MKRRLLTVFYCENKNFASIATRLNPTWIFILFIVSSAITCRDSFRGGKERRLVLSDQLEISLNDIWEVNLPIYKWFSPSEMQADMTRCNKQGENTN